MCFLTKRKLTAREIEGELGDDMQMQMQVEVELEMAREIGGGDLRRRSERNQGDRNQGDRAEAVKEIGDPSP